MNDKDTAALLSLEERGVRALERIAKALDKQESTPPPVAATTPPPPPTVGAGAPGFVQAVLASLGTAPTPPAPTTPSPEIPQPKPAG